MKTFNTILQSLIGWILRIVPLLTPIPTAYVTWRAAIQTLELPDWVAFIMALAVEGLGFAATDTTMMIWDYNETRRKSDPEAPFSLAVATVFFYIAVVLGLTILIEILPVLRHWALAIFPMMTLDAAIVWGLHSAHQRRLEAIEDAKKERQAKRQAVSNKSVKEMSNTSNMDTSLDNLQEGKRLKKKARIDKLLDIYQQAPSAGITSVARQLNTSRQTVYNDLEELEAQNLVRKNGNGVEVLNIE